MMHEMIEQRIREFLAQDDPRLDWVKPIVRRERFLPLYLGWVSALGIRADGSFVRWDHEDAPADVKPLDDTYWQRMALCAAAKKYPELAQLIAPRPVHALTCDACGGCGEVARLPGLLCACGGLGWLLPGEPRDHSPG